MAAPRRIDHRARGRHRRSRFPFGTQGFAVFGNQPSGWLDLWTHWDAHIYTTLARDGYASGGSTVPWIVFYPLYPWLICLLEIVTRDYPRRHPHLLCGVGLRGPPLAAPGESRFPCAPSAALGFVGTIWCALRLRVSYAVWMLFNLLLITSTSFISSVPGMISRSFRSSSGSPRPARNGRSCTRALCGIASFLGLFTLKYVLNHWAF